MAKIYLARYVLLCVLCIQILFINPTSSALRVENNFTGFRVWVDNIEVLSHSNTNPIFYLSRTNINFTEKEGNWIIKETTEVEPIALNSFFLYGESGENDSVTWTVTLSNSEESDDTFNETVPAQSSRDYYKYMGSADDAGANSARSNTNASRIAIGRSIQHPVEMFYGHGSFEIDKCERGDYFTAFSVHTKYSSEGSSDYIIGLKFYCGTIGEHTTPQTPALISPTDFPDTGGAWSPREDTIFGINGNSLWMSTFAPTNIFVKGLSILEPGKDEPKVLTTSNSTFAARWTRIQACDADNQAAFEAQTIYARLNQRSPWVLRHLQFACKELPDPPCYPTEENETLITYNNAKNFSPTTFLQIINVGSEPSGVPFNDTILTDLWGKADYTTWKSPQEIYYKDFDAPPKSKVTVRQLVGSCNKKKFKANFVYIDTCLVSGLCISSLLTL